MRSLRSSTALAGFVLLAGLCLLGCDGPGRVQYDGSRCLRDGRPMTLLEVEGEQAAVASRIASRQPWFAVITIGVVLLAAAGNAERALFLVRARHEQGHRPLVERLRDALERQRENPRRFAAIVGGSLAVVVLAGGAYVYLDVDKRASERALGALQFCHLAMRTQEEQGALDEQRHNLEAIESTAGDIRSLVGKLPPAEQQKAQLIVGQMNTALAKQGKIVGDYAARTDEAQKDLSVRTEAMEKGLASVAGELADLRTLPASLKDLEGAARRIDDTTTSFDARFADLGARIAAVEGKVDSLLARPACVAPAASVPPKVAISAAPVAPPPPKAPAPAAVETDGGKSAP